MNLVPLQARPTKPLAVGVLPGPQAQHVRRPA
jgi:hypothetical protein